MKALVVWLFISVNCAFGSSLVEQNLGKKAQSYHGENHYFETLLNKTNSQTKNLLDFASLQEVLSSLNIQCLNATRVFRILNINEETGLDEHQFAEASLLIAADLAKSSSDCANLPESIDDARSALFKVDNVCQKQVAMVIEKIKDSGKYNSKEEEEKCFGSSTLLRKCTTSRNVTDEVIMNLVLYLANGFCILPEQEYFQDELLEYLGADENGFVTQKQFEKLLLKFNLIQPSDDHNHAGDHDDDDHGDAGDHDNDDHGHAGDHDDDDHKEDGDHDDDHEDGGDHDDDHDDAGDHDDDHEDGGDHGDDDLNHSGDHDDDDEHVEEHEGGSHNQTKVNNFNDTETNDYESQVTSNRTKRDTHDHESHENKCYSSSQLLEIAGASTNAAGEIVLSSEAFLSICPAILQQFVSNACEEEHNEINTVADRSYTTAQKYGYGTLAVLLISLLAFGGLLLFPSIGTVSYQMIMQFFIALGVGSLSGDALLHIIPEVLGLHGHEPEAGGHDHDPAEEDQTYVYKLLVVIGGIYIFFLFENLLRLYNILKNQNISLHQHIRKHSHAAPGHSHSTNHIMTRASISMALERTAEATKEWNKENGHVESVPELREDGEDSSKETSDAVCFGVKPIGVMVFVGDALHNFGDGLALGVAFSLSPVSGLGTSIAIFCHELPHEFGDFAIYLKNGMTKWQALGMNFLAACCAFVGLYIGLSASQNEDARQWMFAVIAGMFLYIALVDVLHEMIEEESEGHPVLLFFLQNFGMILGWTILLLLSLYEDSLRTAFG